jgi:NADH:ubiquinone reductase (non-electrogenic)
MMLAQPTWLICVLLCCRSLLTDEFLRVKGSDGSIWAFGDAATIDQPRALQRADELFELADIDKVRSSSLFVGMQEC